MANITITTSGNSIIIDLGQYSALDRVDDIKESFDCRDIVEVQLSKDYSHLTITMRDAHGSRQWDVTWDTSYSGSEYFIIDSVNAQTPSTQLDLFNKITALRG